MPPEVPVDFSGQATEPSPATAGRSDTLERRQTAYKFFSNLITGAAQRQPREEWKNARLSYEEESDNAALVNMFRAKVDTQAAFLDSEPAVLRFTVPTAHMDSGLSESRRQCEQFVYDYIYDEMEFADVIDQFRHSADITNVGFVALRPNVEKWLPELIYLEPEQVAIDGNCGANIKDAGWVSYSQLASPDELHEFFPAVPLSTFLAAAATKGFRSAFADDNEAKAARAELEGQHGSKGDLKQCRVWRMYARGSYALYDQAPDEQGKGVGELGEAKRPDAEFVMPEGEARRYLFLVEGMDVPLLDRMGWPREFLLDRGESPLTDLTYNLAHDSVYGFPDYRHEKGLLREIERVVKNLAAKHGIEGLKLGTSSSLTMSRETIIEFLEKEGIQVLPGIIGPDGKSMLAVVDIPGITTEDLTYLTTLIELYDQIAMQPRAARGNEDPDKKATATQIETDFATARSNRRLRRFENALAVIAKKTMQMAHVMIPTLTELSKEGEPELVRAEYALVEELVKEPGVKIVRLGAEALAGADAAAWLEMPEGEDVGGFIALLLRSVRISVERGSTQRFVRLQKVAAFRQVFVEVLLPAVQALGATGALVESVKKMLGMMGLDEFESISKELEMAQEQAQMMQAAQVQAQALAQAQPGGAPAAGGPTPAPAPQVAQGGGI